MISKSDIKIIKVPQCSEKPRNGSKRALLQMQKVGVEHNGAKCIFQPRRSCMHPPDYPIRLISLKVVINFVHRWPLIDPEYCCGRQEMGLHSGILFTFHYFSFCSY